MGHRENLLAGAKRCLYERGYARTTARDIVAASGANLASIGYHFGSKAELLTAAMIEAFGEWGRELERVLAIDGDEDGGPIEQLETAWTRIIESFTAHRPLWVASFEALAQAEHVPALREQLAVAHEMARLGLAALLERIEVNTAGEHTTRAVGSFHLALLDGLMVQWLIDPARAPSGQDLAEALWTIVGGVWPADSGRDPPVTRRRGSALAADG